MPLSCTGCTWGSGGRRYLQFQLTFKVTSLRGGRERGREAPFKYPRKEVGSQGKMTTVSPFKDSLVGKARRAPGGAGFQKVMKNSSNLCVSPLENSTHGQWQGWKGLCLFPKRVVSNGGHVCARTPLPPWEKGSPVT